MPKSPKGSGRPYRSHKIRACDLCQRRKSRCTLDLPGRACVMCRVAGVDCCYDEGIEIRRKSPRIIETPEQGQAETSQQGVSPHQTRPDVSKVTIQGAGVDFDASINRTSESTHIVGPILANDAQVVEQYMSPKDTTGQEKATYNVYSNDSREPILYTKVSRRRPGFKSSGCAGAQQLVIMEQILGSFTEELINLYFEKIHPSFPILDRRSLQRPQGQHTLRCEIYAISLLYWNSSRLLNCHPRPDMSYAWNLAVEALQEEFLTPELTSIYSALIDLSGRPSLGLTGNLINSGRTVALAHSLGLNRNPRKWKMSKDDQDIRIRLWWGIVVHDRWASLAHGVPPSITKTNYDVPLPTFDGLKLTGLSQSQYRSVEVFIALCSLSEILGEALVPVYDLQTNPKRNTIKKMRQLEVDLDNWEDGLPEWLHFNERRPLQPVISGSSNLQLGFLAVRLLIFRTRLHISNQSPHETEKLRYHRSECRKGAMDIVDFILALKSANFQEFWLPYSAYHLNSTAILLLRCAIETNDEPAKATCLSTVKRFINFLEKARNEDDWDIAEVCLTHCKATMLRMTGSAQDRDENLSVSRSEGAHDSDYPITFEHADDLTGLSWFGDGMLEGFEFDLGNSWENFGSVLEPI